MEDASWRQLYIYIYMGGPLCKQSRAGGKTRLNTKRFKICGIVLMWDFLAPFIVLLVTVES